MSMNDLYTIWTSKDMEMAPCGTIPALCYRNFRLGHRHGDLAKSCEVGGGKWQSESGQVEQHHVLFVS